MYYGIGRNWATHPDGPNANRDYSLLIEDGNFQRTFLNTPNTNGNVTLSVAGIWKMEVEDTKVQIAAGVATYTNSIYIKNNSQGIWFNNTSGTNRTSYIWILGSELRIGNNAGKIVLAHNVKLENGYLEIYHPGTTADGIHFANSMQSGGAMQGRLY